MYMISARLSDAFVASVLKRFCADANLRINIEVLNRVLIPRLIALMICSISEVEVRAF